MTTRYARGKLLLVRFLKLIPFTYALLIAMEGCGGSSTLVNMWRDPSFQSAPLKKILVIAVRNDPVRRRLWEDTFVGELGGYDVTATPSYNLFPNSLPDTQQVIEAIRANGFEGVLVSRRLSPTVSTSFVPGYAAKEPVIRYNPMTETYNTFYEEVRHPGYVDSEKVARHEVDIWETRGPGKMVWSGTSETVDPGSAPTVKSDVVDVVVGELANQAIIPQKRK